MKLIPLTQNQFAIVDDEDFDFLNQWKWCAHKKKGENTFYARRTGRHNKKDVTITMHSSILNTKNIDHIDGNGLNNQKYNLRKATKSQNAQNKKKSNNKCSSIYKGVSWDSKKEKWRPRLRKDGKLYSFGYFVNEIDAAKAYDAKAKEFFGEFAKLNFDA